MGQGFENSILNQRTDRLDKFSKDYYNLNAQIENDLKVRIRALEEETKQVEDNTKQQLEDLQNLKEGWQNSLDINDDIIEYKGSLKDLLGTEKDSYNDRLSALISFVNSYNTEMSRIKSSSTSTSSTSTSKLSTAESKGYDPNVDYQALISAGESSGMSKSELSKLEDARNAKIDDLNLPYTKTNKYYIGTKYAKEGIANVDEFFKKELLIRNPNSGRFTYLETADGVLPANLTKNIFSVAQNPIKWIKDALLDLKHTNTNTKETASVISIGDIKIYNPIGDGNSLAREINNTIKSRGLQVSFSK